MLRRIDIPSPITQNINSLVYLKDCFMKNFNMILASPIVKIMKIIKHIYANIPASKCHTQKC